MMCSPYAWAGPVRGVRFRPIRYTDGSKGRYASSFQKSKRFRTSSNQPPVTATEQGDPVTVPLTIQEHVDGEWIIEKVVLKQLDGERNEQVEKEIPHGEMFEIKRIDTANVEYQMQLPPTTIDRKYDLYVTVLRKNRRY